MARIDTLEHYLTDLADAIRAKTGSSATISADAFDTDISGIPSGDPSVYFDGNFKDSTLSPTEFYCKKYFKAAPVAIDCTGKTSLSEMFRINTSATSYCPMPITPHLTNVTAVTNISNMYTYQLYATEIPGVTDLANAPLDNVSGAFSECREVLELDTSNWPWSTITNAASVFSGCNKMTSCPGFYNPENETLTIAVNAVNCSYMFQGCYALHYKYAVLNLPEATTCERILASSGLDYYDTDAEIYITVNAPKCNNFTAAFLNIGAYSSTTHYDHVKKVTVDFQSYLNTTMRLSSLLSYGGATILELKNLQPASLQSQQLQWMFSGDASNPVVTSIVFTNCNFNCATNLSSMFQTNPALTSLDLSSVFSNCTPTNVGNMFYSCRALTHLDVRGITFSGLSSGSFNNLLWQVPTTCEIIVKDATEKAWFNTNFSTYTNVMTAAEYDAL